MFDGYLERVCADIRRANVTAAEMGGAFEPQVDSIYLGGGTPTVLESAQLERIFAIVRETFAVAPDAEITTECAPGTLASEMLDALQKCGVNRISLGVQSFVDEEARAVGRRHTRAVTIDDIARLRSAGMCNINIDLIAGLPHQTDESWRVSLDETIASGAPHVSVYMLEVDEDSRLGREVIAGGTRYHAHFVPDENLTADLYVEACDRLNAAGVCQYEISNFSRAGCESRHNLKYWTRQPYLGFGVDAHSFLPVCRSAFPPCRSKLSISTGHAIEDGGAALDGVRFASPDSLDAYLAGVPLERTPVTLNAAREESFFLGLRLNRGVDLNNIASRYSLSPRAQGAISELYEMGLIDYERDREVIRLTRDGRLLSNEVFERFIGA